MLACVVEVCDRGTFLLGPEWCWRSNAFIDTPFDGCYLTTVRECRKQRLIMKSRLYELRLSINAIVTELRLDRQ